MLDLAAKKSRYYICSKAKRNYVLIIRGQYDNSGSPRININKEGELIKINQIECQEYIIIKMKNH